MFSMSSPKHLLGPIIPAPSNRSPLEAFEDLKVAGGDLLEGAGTVGVGLLGSLIWSKRMVFSFHFDRELISRKYILSPTLENPSMWLDISLLHDFVRVPLRCSTT